MTTKTNIETDEEFMNGISPRTKVIEDNLPESPITDAITKHIHEIFSNDRDSDKD